MSHLGEGRGEELRGERLRDARGADRDRLAVANLVLDRRRHGEVESVGATSDGDDDIIDAEIVDEQ